MYKELWGAPVAASPGRLDIHRHTGDNTMNFRRLQLGELVRQTVEDTGSL